MNNIDTYCAVYYNQVYARIPPYLVGIILGSFLHWTKDRKLNWSPVRNAIDQPIIVF